jgi:hypothetical protein
MQSCVCVCVCGEMIICIFVRGIRDILQLWCSNLVPVLVSRGVIILALQVCGERGQVVLLQVLVQPRVPSQLHSRDMLFRPTIEIHRPAAHPQDRLLSRHAKGQEGAMGREANLTKLRCTPRERCVPEQFMQRNTPRVTEAHVGAPLPHSKHAYAWPPSSNVKNALWWLGVGLELRALLPGRASIAFSFGEVEESISWIRSMRSRFGDPFSSPFI